MSRWRKVLWPGVATLIALAILVSLGTWQLSRRVEKEAVLAALERGAQADPLPLEAAALSALNVLAAGSTMRDGALPELTRVRIEGLYRPDLSIPVRATLPATKGASSSGLGFFWMAPLDVGDGRIVFINRGFVPSGSDFRPPRIATPTGRQSVTGLLRLPEKRQFFMAADQPEKGEFSARDPAVMAAAAKLDPAKVAPFFIDAERRSPDDATPPVGVLASEMIARIPNNHLQYAVTWFGLALTLVGVFTAFAWSRLKGEA
jgi:surfeit locus 1 family protein